MSDLWWISTALLWAFVLLQAVVLWALARQVGLLQRRIAPTGARMANAGLDLGNEAPWFSEQDLRGRRLTPAWERGKPSLLVFTSMGCPACEDLYGAIATLTRYESANADIVVVGLQADSLEHRAYAAEHGLDRLPYVMAPEVAEAYQVAATPYAILVDAEGTVYTKGIANSLEHLESLLNALEAGYPSFDAKMNAIHRVPVLTEPDRVEPVSHVAGGRDAGS